MVLLRGATANSNNTNITNNSNNAGNFTGISAEVYHVALGNLHSLLSKNVTTFCQQLQRINSTNNNNSKENNKDNKKIVRPLSPASRSLLAEENAILKAKV